MIRFSEFLVGVDSLCVLSEFPLRPQGHQRDAKGKRLLETPFGDTPKKPLSRSKLSDDTAMSSKWWVLPLHANLPPEERCFFRRKGVGMGVEQKVRFLHGMTIGWKTTKLV